jgi:hypothetical protein
MRLKTKNLNNWFPFPAVKIWEEAGKLTCLGRRARSCRSLLFLCWHTGPSLPQESTTAGKISLNSHVFALVLPFIWRP